MSLLPDPQRPGVCRDCFSSLQLPARSRYADQHPGGDQLVHAVVNFDEAHNLESFASESASFDLTGVDLGGCIGEVQRAISYMQTMPEMAAEIGSGRCVRGMFSLHV